MYAKIRVAITTQDRKPARIQGGSLATADELARHFEPLVVERGRGRDPTNVRRVVE